MTTPPDPRAARETAAAALDYHSRITSGDPWDESAFVLWCIDRLPTLAALVTALADEVERLTAALLAASDGEAES